MIGIVAVSRNKVIGNNGKIPWNVPEDLRWFKEATTNSIVVVGRNTFKTLPPLKGREVWVLTRAPEKENEISSPLDIPVTEKKIFLAGGAEVYKSYMSLCSEFYVTEIEQDCEGDAFFCDEFYSLFKESALIKEGAGFKVKSYIKII